jgi:cytoskeleton protein RodZ
LSPLVVGAGEIGRALREARERLGLRLDDAEEATHIRVTYLAALEREQFERLPGSAYTRSFLREYAQFLGLDPQPLLSAFAELVPEEEAPALRPVGLEHHRSLPRRSLLLALGGLVILLIGLGVWLLAGSHTTPVATPPTHAPKPAPRPQPPHHVRHQAPTAARLVLRARGRCWLWIRTGSASGPVVYEATLTAGRSLHYSLATQLWVRVGAPWNLDVLLNGRRVAGLPLHPGNVLITRQGISPG